MMTSTISRREFLILLGAMALVNSVQTEHISAERTGYPPSAIGSGTTDWKNQILKGQIKAFCIDFNWGPDGPNGFAGPGHWADADPVKHVDWYEKLGVNIIQTFAVSCNGYAWYKNGRVPKQPGLKHDFLTEVVRLAHVKKMMVMGYFCIAANTLWGQQHPYLSYGFPSGFHIPLTDEYLDYLSISIEDALIKTGMDGFMIDWAWNPDDISRKAATEGKWLDAEKKLYGTLMGKPFPDGNHFIKEDRLVYERRAIERCWTRIRKTAKRVKPDCIIWLSCSHVGNPVIANSLMLKQVDWMMDEVGNPEAMKSIAPMLGKHTRQLLCLVGLGDRHNARQILSNPVMTSYGIYGFIKPQLDSLPMPAGTYLSRPIDAFSGNEKNIATLFRYFNGKSFEFVTPPSGGVK